MKHIASRTMDQSLAWPNNATPLSEVRRTSRANPTTAIDRVLLMATIVLLPLQEQIYIVAGPDSSISIMFIMFGLLGAYVLLRKPGALARVSIHPLFLAMYGLLCVGFVIESMRPNSSYYELKSSTYMIAGAVIVASLCRDSKALRACLYGYVLAAIWLSVFLVLNYYGSLRGTTATNLYDATSVRDKVFREIGLDTGLNTIAFIIAEGVAVSLTLALSAPGSRQRKLFLGVALLCLVATFLPMSRSAVMIAVVSSAAILIAHRGKRMRALIATVALAIGVLVWVPDVAVTRLFSSMTSSYYSSLSSSDYKAQGDGRSLVYAAAVESLPKYLIAGVGAGNFWTEWGYKNGFGNKRGISGSHNLFLQLTIYWGLPGLVGLLVVIWYGYRCIPKGCGSDPQSLALLGVAVSLLLWTLSMHNLYAKEFSLGLGMMVGARFWIWPKGIVRSSVARTKAAASRAGTSLHPRFVQPSVRPNRSDR